MDVRRPHTPHAESDPAAVAAASAAPASGVPGEPQPGAEPHAAAPQEALARARAAVSAVLEGQDELVDLAFACLVAGGHLLLEGVPGTGKTTLARAIARSSGLGFSRIQMTADVMPTDVTGALYPREDGSGALEFRPGPVFASVVLADELNRTPPRTQSALLEAMAERSVTVDGRTHPLPTPFFLVATQNPLEFAGTYPLPESQLDRFTIRLRPGYPSRDAEARMLRARRGADPLDALRPSLDATALLGLRALAEGLAMAPAVEEDLVEIVRATRVSPELALGASPRATLDLDRMARGLAVVEGRDFVAPDDVRRAAVATIAHRVVARDGALDDAEEAEAAIVALLASLPAPRLDDGGRLAR